MSNQEMKDPRLKSIQERYDQRKYVVTLMGQDHLYAHTDICYLLKEIKRLQGKDAEIERLKNPCKSCNNTGWVETGVEHLGISESVTCDCSIGDIVSTYEQLIRDHKRHYLGG